MISCAGNVGNFAYFAVTSIHGWICAATSRSVNSVRGAAAVIAGSAFKWFAMIGEK